MTRRSNAEVAQTVWGSMSQIAIDNLEDLTKKYSLRIASGDLLYLAGTWYITHAGLLRIAHRRRCSGIMVKPAHQFCDPAAYDSECLGQSNIHECAVACATKIHQVNGF
jgi:hypothetical protein